MAYQSEIEKLEQRFGEKPEQWFAALADAYRKAGELDMALDLLNTWIEKRPNYTSGHIVRGRCLLDKQELEEAAKAFQGVLGLDPENIIAIRALSEIAAEMGDSGDARHWLERLLEVDPMNEEAQQALEALAAAPPVAEAPPAEVEAVEEPSAVELEPPAPTPQPAAAEERPVSEPSTEPTAPFDPLAIADEMTTDSPSAEQAPAAASGGDVEEISLDIETGTPSPVEEPQVEAPAEELPVAPLEGLETKDEAAVTEFVVETDGAESGLEGLETAETESEKGEEGGVQMDGLQLGSFDEELAWDAGDRISHQISREDIEEAQHAHENSLDSPAHLLPGIEEEEVPDVGVEERELPPPVEGLDVPPEEPAEELEPVSGFEPTAAAAGEQGPADETAAEDAAASSEEPPRTATPEPTPEPQRPAAEAPVEPERPAPEAPVEPEPAPEPQPARAKQPLPLIMPEERPQEPAADAEPEPVVTETMAEVYANQGLFAEAAGVYEQLLAAKPGDAALTAKLADVRSRATAARAPAAPPKRDQYAAAATGGLAVRDLFAELLGQEPAATAIPDGLEIAQPEASAPAAAAPEEEGAGYSFDQFFGDESKSGGSPPSTRRAAEGDGNEDNFRDWLKSLKS